MTGTRGALPSPATDPRPAGRVRHTRQAEAIEAVLGDTDKFRTAQELFDELRRVGANVGLTTVYRHLGLMADTGQVDVVHRADGESQYRLCGTGERDHGHGGAEHHHHLVCRVCGRSVEISAPEVEAWAEQVASTHGYTEASHTLEIFGLCPDHSAARKTPKGPRRR